jgi:FixJ family two-component response regulator
MSRTGQTLVLVDDDESVRKALGRLLRAAGWDVAVFASAEEFLHAAAPASPACLILDVHLPGLSGPELQERLHAQGCKPPIVFISAYQDEGVRDLALQAGAVAFLQKPFEERALLDAVDRAV